jgi:oxygen-independent coproporphyrinogen III oxidase
MLYIKDFYEKLSESIDSLDYSSYTLQYPPPFIGPNIFENSVFTKSFKETDIDSLGIYIHIPFCETKCTFCRYYSIIDSSDVVHTKYIEYIIKELQMYLAVLWNKKISSLYIWGWTPSAISAENIEKLLGYFFTNFKITSDFQFCFEANPSSVTFEKVSTLSKYHCHRFTLWIQSLDQWVLKKVNRRQSTKDVIQAISWAKQVWINFVNVDMMAGIRWQSLISFVHDIKKVLSLNPDMIHIHPYTATVRVIDEKIYSVDEKLSIQMSKIWNSLLEKEGYFSVEGDANGKSINSRNKQLYDAQLGWGYIGIWVSAIGYNWLYRTINHDTLESYFSSIDKGEFPIKFASWVWEKAKMIQYIIYNMRYGKIWLWEFVLRFWKDILEEFPEVIKTLIDEWVVKISSEYIHFQYKTPKEYSIYSKYFYEETILTHYRNTYNL